MVGVGVKSKEGANMRWSVRVENEGAANNVHTTMQALIISEYTATGVVLLYVGWVQNCKKYRPTSHANFRILYRTWKVIPAFVALFIPVH